jgi:hypothetical protein
VGQHVVLPLFGGTHPSALRHVIVILCDRLRKMNEHLADVTLPQLFLAVDPAEMERVRRFGEVRRYGAGEALFKIGEAGHGLFVILAGRCGGPTSRRWSAHEAGAPQL